MLTFLCTSNIAVKKKQCQTKINNFGWFLITPHSEMLPTIYSTKVKKIDFYSFFYLELIRIYWVWTVWARVKNANGRMSQVQRIDISTDLIMFAQSIWYKNDRTFWRLLKLKNKIIHIDDIETINVFIWMVNFFFGNNEIMSCNPILKRGAFHIWFQTLHNE